MRHQLYTTEENVEQTDDGIGNNSETEQRLFKSTKVPAVSEQSQYTICRLLKYCLHSARIRLSDDEIEI